MIWRTLLLSCFFLLGACGGGGSSGSNAGVSTAPVEQVKRLTVADVKKVLARAIDQASALGVDATIAVVDRVGNVLAVHRMATNSATVTISSTFPTTISTGLEGVVLPAGSDGDALAAISKALTGAYLSSEGNAFSSRTASQIVQENFNPGEQNQPAGPLFGVQFSQLACSDFSLRASGNGVSVGPQRSPLGLSADPGGFPLYKGGVPVGGVGVIADQRYSLDKNIQDRDRDLDEQIALAATFDFAAPRDRRAGQITVDGKTLRFSDVEFADLPVAPEQAPGYDSLVGAGSLVAVNTYSSAKILAGTVFQQAESGVRVATDFSDLDAFVFVDEDNQNRFPPRAGGDNDALQGSPLSAGEVRRLLASALAVANRSRAQIRRPLGTPARVTISVVDSQGGVLGMLRSRDAPVFGADVSLQKARTAAFFSSKDAGEFLRDIPKPAVYVDENLMPKAVVDLGDYVTAAQAFVGPDALADGTAFSDRAGGNLSRPFYPDGIRGNPHGPFSKSFADNEWSVFSTGLQLDLVINHILQHVLFAAAGAGQDVGSNCTDADTGRIANGIQIFPGSVPVYRGSELVGGIGVSGDGVDQDDMIAFLGLHEAGLALDGSINNAPKEVRADRLTPQGERLRFIQCPQSPYFDSDEQNVCGGR